MASSVALIFLKTVGGKGGCKNLKKISTDKKWEKRYYWNKTCGTPISSKVNRYNLVSNLVVELNS